MSRRITFASLPRAPAPYVDVMPIIAASRSSLRLKAFYQMD